MVVRRRSSPSPRRLGADMHNGRHLRAFSLPSGREAVLEATRRRNGSVAFEVLWAGPGDERWLPETVAAFMAWRKRAEAELRAELGAAGK